jgi:hypothetical protein
MGLIDYEDGTTGIKIAWVKGGSNENITKHRGGKSNNKLGVLMHACNPSLRQEHCKLKASLRNVLRANNWLIDRNDKEYSFSFFGSTGV